MVSYFTDHLSTYCTNRGAVIGRQYKKAISEEAQAKQTLIDAREQFIALYIANETVASQNAALKHVFNMVCSLEIKKSTDMAVSEIERYSDGLLFQIAQAETQTNSNQFAV